MTPDVKTRATNNDVFHLYSMTTPKLVTIQSNEIAKKKEEGIQKKTKAKRKKDGRKRTQR